PTLMPNPCSVPRVLKRKSTPDEIHSRDPWFLIYTVPESTRATQFPKAGTHFFDTLAKVIQA
uniref:Uncharacterized protein n=1 Tax=Caenorhabditis japonica TaxID=281687 RepID=A0A8R1EF91_CAEJA